MKSLPKFLNSKTLFYFSFLLLGALFISNNFTLAGKENMEKPTFENTVINYDKQVGEADYLYQVLHYNSYLHSDDEGLSELLNIYEGKRQNLINDNENFKKIKSLRDEYIKNNVQGEKRVITDKWYKYLDKFIVLDPNVKKLQKEEMEFKNKLNRVWNVYRPKLKDQNGKYIKDKSTGKDKLFNGSEIIRIESQSKDRDERKRAFEARSEVGYELASSGFKDLIKKRNEFAVARGYKDYYDMIYTQSGLNEDELFQIFDRFVKGTDDTTKKTIERFIKEEGFSKFEPWDVEYARSGFSSLIDGYLPKEGMASALKISLREAGIDLEKFNIHMDLEPRTGKYPHAACWWVKFADNVNGKWTGEDMRLLANLDKGGLEQYSTLFHETGHAVHGANVRQKYTIDKNVNLTSYYELGGIAEGIAHTFEKLVEEPEWFVKYAEFDKPNKSKEDIAKLKEAFSKYESKAKPWSAFNTRLFLVKVYFEREIYKNPNADFNKVWWDKMQKLLFVEKHEEYPHWGHKAHFISNPAYYQFYVLASLISEQNLHYFKAKYGKIVDNPNFGKDLVEKYFVTGNSVPWEDMMVKLTGEKLNPQYKIDAVTKF